jgi:hypothetical protein
MCYFEFLPLHCSNGSAEPSHRDLVDLVHVKLGHEYELVVTTYSGMSSGIFDQHSARVADELFRAEEIE